MTGAALAFAKTRRLSLVRLAGVVLIVAAAPSLAADLNVTQKKQTFSTPTMSLHVGDTLYFHNDDDVTHNITVRGADGDSEDLGLQKPGVAVHYKFTDPGAYRVICSIHPKMKMTVEVQ